MVTRETDIIFKHLKNLNKAARLQKLLIKRNKQSTLLHEQVDILNEFFRLVLSPITPFSINDFDIRKLNTTICDISKKTIGHILSSLNVKKAKSPNENRPVFISRRPEKDDILNIRC